MTDEEITEELKRGAILTFGCHAHNGSIMALMADLEKRGLIETRDLGLSQETRREARWIGPREAN